MRQSAEYNSFLKSKKFIWSRITIYYVLKMRFCMVRFLKQRTTLWLCLRSFLTANEDHSESENSTAEEKFYLKLVFRILKPFPRSCKLLVKVCFWDISQGKVLIMVMWSWQNFAEKRRSNENCILKLLFAVPWMGPCKGLQTLSTMWSSKIHCKTGVCKITCKRRVTLPGDCIK